MTPTRITLAAVLLVAGGLSASAQGVPPAVRPPVDHPVCAAAPVRSAAGWRKGVEGFGERLVTESLERRGYTVSDRKLPGNHGIDLVAFKRGVDGRVTDLKLVEAKTHYGSSKPRLGQTANGRQMSDAWLRARVRALPDRELARDISRLVRERGGSYTPFAEVSDTNLRRGTLTVRDARLNPLGRPQPVGEILRSVADESPSAASGRWADRHLAHLEALRQTRMTSWLGESSASRALNRVASEGRATGPAGWGSAARGVGRALGVMGAVLTLADVGLDVYGWQTGSLTRREFVTRTAGHVGGFAGAWAGGWAGVWIGAEIGVLGGPLGWFTVPAGGVIGGVIGGTVGYYAGSAFGQAVADGCYALMDEQTRAETSARLRDTPFPLDR